eukprot:TRINITY_DN23063_c0_g1_i1.p1 TRINITY_DN23063_c0_g1~~TRINITY_DN23063_c0_g1_i1.p1  ORF type:complete len:387 (+),score=106.63 TRINITY_DN23063_c0_g1_i1:105-1265(+)
MGRAKDVMNRSLLNAWGLVDTDVLEQEFDLSTRNLGGAHSEALENKHENRRWNAHLTIIPSYDSRNDPHLTQFHKKQRKEKKKRRQKKARTGKGREGVSAAGERPASPADVDISLLGEGGDWEDRGQHFEADKRSQVCPESYIVSTEHVLELKRVFFRASEVDPEAGQHAAPRRIPRHRALFYYQRGVDVTNSTAKLHRRGTIKPASLPRLLTVLRALTDEGGLDWSAYLLLCTINLGSQRELRKLLILKDAHERYLSTYAVDSERAFCEMLLFLNGGVHINSTDQIVSFYQNGDFYQSRGSFTSFPETVFSLHEHITQTYIARARARGPRLAVNFAGHRPPGNVGGAPAKDYQRLFPIQNKSQVMWEQVAKGAGTLDLSRREWMP